VPDGRIPPLAADGFGRGADVYERSRPSYPPEAVACIVGHAHLGPERRVLDLAAGTGKLTRVLVPSGADVVAVEPVPAMRAELRAVLPDLEVLDGTAETIPLGDQSVDAVTVAQAVHWFELPQAVPEILRVLRPGGALVLVWNLPDESVDWIQQFSEAIDVGAGLPFRRYDEHDYGEEITALAGTALGERGAYVCDWDQPCDAALLVQRAASVSVVAALDHDERAAVLARVEQLAATHPDLVGRPVFPFPYTTRVLWWQRN
jgi:SAM-dependent methyltransferase